MATINKQTGIVGTGSENQTTSIATPLAEGELGLQQNRGEISVGTKNGNVVLEGTVLTDKRIADKAKSGFVSSGVINKQDDANIFKTAVGNEYKMANTDRFVNFDGNVIDTYGEELVSRAEEDWASHAIGTSYSISGNRFTFDYQGNTGGTVYTSFTTEIGKTYTLTFNVISQKADCGFEIGTTTTGSGIYSSSDIGLGKQKVNFKAISNTTYINFKETDAATDNGQVIDNISVREITTVDMTDMIPEVMVVGWTA